MSPLDFFQPIIVFLTSALAAFLLFQNPSLARKRLFIVIQSAVIALDVLLVTVVSSNWRINFAGMLDQIAFSLLIVVIFSRLILIYRAHTITTDRDDESLAP
jgi:FtsH-binding integral membrane protein